MELIVWALPVIIMGLISAKSLRLSTCVYYIQFTLFALMVFLGLLFPLVPFPFRPFDYRNANFSAKFAIHMGALMGARYKLKGRENLKKSGGIILLNHQSFLDIIVLGHLWMHLGPVAVIMKKEILYFPPVGIPIWSYGSIFIDRSNRKAAIRSIEKASQAINKDGKKLLFFPEGTRSVTDTLLPFRNGAFISAFENQCDVYPIVVSKFGILDHIKKLYKPEMGSISILEPISAKDFSDYKALKEHCQMVMQTEYSRLNAVNPTTGAATTNDLGGSGISSRNEVM